MRFNFSCFLLLLFLGALSVAAVPTSGERDDVGLSESTVESRAGIDRPATAVEAPSARQEHSSLVISDGVANPSVAPVVPSPVSRAGLGLEGLSADERKFTELDDFYKGFHNGQAKLSPGNKAICVDGYVKVDVPRTKLADVPALSLPKLDTMFDTIKIMQTYLFRHREFKKEHFGEQESGGEKFKILASLCYPRKGDAWKEKSLQFLVHDIGFTNKYWMFDNSYSWVDQAAHHGYATFRFDRIGVGLSEAPDSPEKAQALLQMIVVERLTEKLKKGDLSLGKFNRIVGVGHGIGSALLRSVCAIRSSRKQEDLYESLVLTGWTPQRRYVNWEDVVFPALRPAKGSEPTCQSSVESNPNRPEDAMVIPAPTESEWANTHPSYLLISGDAAQQFLNFNGDFNDTMMAQVNQNAPGKLSIGELLTINTLPKKTIRWKGPIHLVLGDSDILYGPARTPKDGSEADTLRELLGHSFGHRDMDWKGKSRFTWVGHTGHAINLHHTAQKTIDTVMWWLNDLDVPTRFEPGYVPPKAGDDGS